MPQGFDAIRVYKTPRVKVPEGLATRRNKILVVDTTVLVANEIVLCVDVVALVVGCGKYNRLGRR